MSSPAESEDAQERIDIIREYLEQEGSGQEHSFADQVAEAELHGGDANDELVVEVRAELEDFLGESGASYESVTAMVEEADRRMADIAYGGVDEDGNASFDYHDDLDETTSAELTTGLGY